MRILAIAGLLFLFSATAHGQWEVDFADRNFFQMRSALVNYYDSLAAAGDSSAFHEGGPYSRFMRWSAFWSLRLKEHSNFPDYFNAESLARSEMQNRSAGNTDPWYEIGPKDKPGLGVTSIGQGSQPGIGPIHFLSFSDADSDKMLCGSNIGGIWYTANGGLQWNNGGSDGGAWKRTGCRNAQFKVGDASTWYAANSGYFFYSGAILRGNNYGAQWEVIADHSDFPAGGVWTSVNKLVTDHENPDVLYAATEHRLWRTTNVNYPDPDWSEVIIPIPPDISTDPVFGVGSAYVFNDVRGVYDLEVDPLNSDNLYATVRFEGEASATDKVKFWRLMRSQDGGSTWTEMPNQPTHPFFDIPITVWIDGVATSGVEHRNANFMTIENTNANADWLYVFYDLNGSVDELHKVSSASLGTWEPPLRTDIKGTYGGGNGFGVDQFNGEDVYIEHSASLGRYATYVNGSWTNYNSTGNYLQYHVDVEDFVGDPENEGVVWMANHGGIHRSDDGGANWEWRGSGLAVAEVYRMANSYSEPDRLITGLFHDASVLTEGEYGPMWEPEWRQLGGGDGQQPLIEHDEGSRVYWSSQGASWNKSSNYGSSPQNMSAWNCACLAWETAAALDNGLPNAIYLPGWSVVGFGGCQNGSPCHAVNTPAEIKRSFDRGATWEVISDFSSVLGPGRKGVWRMYSSPYDANDLLVHFPDGQRVFRTRMARGIADNVQASWREIYVPRTDRFIADIDFDPTNQDVLYFAYSSEVMDDDVADGSGMLFKVTYVDPSDPMSANSVDLSAPGGGAAALPNTGVGSEAVVLERGSNGGIYIGTDLGVFYSNNDFLSNGTGWQLLGENLPRSSCAGLEISYKANRLRAGMSGRGVWEHDLWCPQEPPLAESGTYAASAFLETMSTITSTAIVPPGLNIAYRGGEEVHMLPGFHASEGGLFHAFIHPCDQVGNSFKSMLGGDAPTEREDSTDKLLDQSQITVQPNPNKGSFSVKLPNASLPAKELRLLSAQGRTVHVNWNPSTASLEVTVGDHTPAGIYILEVILSDGSLCNTKMVIQP